MAISPIALAKERARQEAAEDDNFFTKQTYFFELRVPEEVAVGVQTKFLFPLMVPPESYSMEEPFAVEATPTQGGGLYVEENGIIQRMIKISGTTGFRPRQLISGVTGSGLLAPEKMSFGRELPAFVATDVSGQRHFQYLQDAVFRAYADLKRDPALSKDTSLVFHNPKDEEHWLVVPQKFTLERDKAQPVLYRYNIELLVVDRADSVDADFSEDKALLDAMKDKIAFVNTGIQMIAGAINDVTAIVAEIENLVKSVGTIISSVGTVIDAASNFVEGVVDLIQTPLALLDSVGEVIESANNLVDTVRQAGADIKQLPDNITQKFRQLEDGLNRIGSHPAAFENPIRAKAREQKQRQELATAVSDTVLDTALVTPAPTTLAENATLGTGITQGDAISSRSELGVGREVPNFTSVRQRRIERGDTLVNLAARYLGDARLWQHIAIVNGLKPPFVMEDASADLSSSGDERVPGVLGLGDTILIPNFSKPPQEQPNIPVLGVRLEEPAEAQLLGTDLALEVVGGRPGAPLFDIPIDVEGGSVDAKKVVGVACLSQALDLKVRTEKGTDIIYKRSGIDRVIGFNHVAADIEQIKFRFSEAIQQDTRIATVRRVSFEQTGAGDVLTLDADVEVRGFSEPAKIRSEL